MTLTIILANTIAAILIAVALYDTRRATAKERADNARLTLERDIEQRRADRLLLERDEYAQRNRRLHSATTAHLLAADALQAHCEALEAANRHLERATHYRKEVLAGAMLTQGLVRVDRKMRVVDGAR